MASGPDTRFPGDRENEQWREARYAAAREEERYLERRRINSDHQGHHENHESEREKAKEPARLTDKEKPAAIAPKEAVAEKKPEPKPMPPQRVGLQFRNSTVGGSTPQTPDGVSDRASAVWKIAEQLQTPAARFTESSAGPASPLRDQMGVRDEVILSEEARPSRPEPVNNERGAEKAQAAAPAAEAPEKEDWTGIRRSSTFQQAKTELDQRQQAAWREATEGKPAAPREEVRREAPTSQAGPDDPTRREETAPQAQQPSHTAQPARKEPEQRQESKPSQPAAREPEQQSSSTPQPKSQQQQQGQAQPQSTPQQTDKPGQREAESAPQQQQQQTTTQSPQRREGAPPPTAAPNTPETPDSRNSSSGGGSEGGRDQDQGGQQQQQHHRKESTQQREGENLWQPRKEGGGERGDQGQRRRPRHQSQNPGQDEAGGDAAES